MTNNKFIDINSFSGEKRPSIHPIGIKNCKLYLMKKIVDYRGSLSVGEFSDGLPFNPQRYFIVYEVPSQEVRGEHAHKKCDQFLICVKGSCNILLDDGINKCKLLLDSPSNGIYMPAGIWGSQFNYSKDAVLLVFASLPYDPEDYIRTYSDYNEFIFKN